MKHLLIAAATAGMLTLSACDGGADDAAQERLEEVADNRADALEERAEDIRENAEEIGEAADDHDNPRIANEAIEQLNQM